MQSRRRAALFVFLAFAPGLLNADFLRHPVKYTMTDLGDVGVGEPNFPTAVSINDFSQIVIQAGLAPHAFLWQRGTVTELPPVTPMFPYSIPSEINNRGQVTGSGDRSVTGSENRRGFLWSGGTMTELGSLGGGSVFALGMNHRGQVVGGSDLEPGAFNYYPFLWENGVMRNLGHPDQTAISCSASDINDLQQVVVNCQGGRAFLWEKGRFIDLGSLGGGDTVAHSLNNLSQVAGVSRLPNGQRRAFLWQREAFFWGSGRMTNLGTLGGDDSFATGINDFGQVVGTSMNAAGHLRAFLWRRQAFLWGPATMIDLGTLGGDSSSANDINNKGEIVGSSRNAAGVDRAFLATWR